jgi:hypothetical protein
VSKHLCRRKYNPLIPPYRRSSRDWRRSFSTMVRTKLTPK